MIMWVLPLIAMLVAPLLTAPTASAATVVRGTVMCISQDSVVGVWIQAEKGGSTWAKLTSTGLGYYKRYQVSLPKGGRYQVHVGCGEKNKYWWGGGKVWKTNNKSSYVTGGKNFTCWDVKNPISRKGLRPGAVVPYEKCTT